MHARILGSYVEIRRFFLQAFSSFGHDGLTARRRFRAARRNRIGATEGQRATYRTWQGCA
jgi:hypothetical protein